MKLNDLLIKKKSPILNNWLNMLLQSYSSDARRFFTKQKDRFANPVGTTLSRDLEKLYDLMIEEWDTNRISSVLENIIRLRAIQDFLPSQALSFIFELKKILREELRKEIVTHDLLDEVLEMEVEIDRLALLGFDVYSNCRQRLYEIRVNEVKNQISGLMRKSGMVVDFENQEPTEVSIDSQ